jgi:hypothetical protein
MTFKPRRHEGHEDLFVGDHFVCFVCFVVSSFRRYFPFGFAGTVVICANS